MYTGKKAEEATHIIGLYFKKIIPGNMPEFLDNDGFWMLSSFSVKSALTHKSLIELSRPAGERKEDHTIDGVTKYALTYKLDHLTKEATHYNTINDCFFIKTAGELAKVLYIHANGWVTSDCTTNAELDSDEFWRLDGKQIIEPVTVPEFPSDFYQKGGEVVNTDLHTPEPVDQKEINAATALYAFAGWLTSMKEPITFSEKHWASPAAVMVDEFIQLNKLNDDIDFDLVKTPSDSVIIRPKSNPEDFGAIPGEPVFTQEMRKAGETPAVGCELVSSETGNVIVCRATFDSYIWATIKNSGFKPRTFTPMEYEPIDNRSDDERLRDELSVIAIPKQVDQLLSSDKFTITLKE